MTNTGLVDGTFDPSYRALQNCEASSGTAFDVLVEIGLSQSVVVNGSKVAGISPGICPDEIIWFNDNEHFKTLTALTGTLEVSRETVEDADKRFTVTSSGLITWTKDIGIKVEHDSEYLAAIRNIIMSDSINGYEGALIQAYSNGGFHMRITLTNSAEGYALKEVILNAKTANFVDLFSEIDDEAEFTQSFNVEASPLYELDGNVEKALGLPFDAKMAIDGSVTDSTATFTVNVDSTYESITKKAFVQVIDKGASDKAAAAAVVNVGESYEMSLPTDAVGPFKIQGFYAFEQAQLLIPGHTVEVAGSTSAVATIANMSPISATSFRIDYGYTANSEDAALASLVINDGTTDVDTLTPLTTGNGQTYDFTSAVDATEYTISIMQDGRMLDSEVYTHTAPAVRKVETTKKRKTNK